MLGIAAKLIHLLSILDESNLTVRANNALEILICCSLILCPLLRMQNINSISFSPYRFSTHLKCLFKISYRQLDDNCVCNTSADLASFTQSPAIFVSVLSEQMNPSSTSDLWCLHCQQHVQKTADAVYTTGLYFLCFVCFTRGLDLHRRRGKR